VAMHAITRIATHEPCTGSVRGTDPVQGRVLRWLRLHWMLMVLLGIGAGLRVLTVLAYRTGLPARAAVDRLLAIPRKPHGSAPRSAASDWL